MTSDTLVLGISNAVVDILAHVEEDFLERIGAAKRSMVLIDEQRARQIYSMMGPATEQSGGSVANAIAGIANLGGRTAYIGRVADDQLGRIFIHDLQSLGVDVRLLPVEGGPPTARSYILITPDGERTMQTYLGACTTLSVDDISGSTVGTPRVVLLEGYIWDTPQGAAAAAEAMRLTRGSAIAALSLSDAECVARHRQEFLDAIRSDVRMVFANEAEIIRLLDADRFESALDRLADFDGLFVLTRSARGSVVVEGRKRVVQPAIPVDKLVDATGAGDAYMAGFLYGWTSGRSLQGSAELASRCASAVIQQVGARLEKGFLATLSPRHGGRG